MEIKGTAGFFIFGDVHGFGFIQEIRERFYGGTIEGIRICGIVMGGLIEHIVQNPYDVSVFIS